MPRKHPRRKPRRPDGLGKKPLGELLARHPEVLEVLHDHGVHFCAGCYLTLFSPVEKVAAYHAVPDLGDFLGDLRKALGRKARG